MATAESITGWVQTMERLGEADMPMHIAGYVMTPHELLNHARANDQIWNAIKNTM
jgi:hypothetical protein